MPAYLQALPLSGRQRLDAQGNCFHLLAATILLIDPLATWLCGDALPRAAFPSPQELLRQYAVVRTW
eukprot:13505839-Alexandrium_andersonii.AAC.1